MKVKISTIIAILFASLIFLDIEVVSGVKLYWSHIIMLLVIGLLYFSFLMKEPDAIVYLFFGLILLVFFWFSALVNGPGERFKSDFIKTFIYIFGAYALTKTFNSDELYKILKYLSIFYIFYLIHSYLMAKDAFLYAGRLLLEEGGSPNALASVLGALIILLLFELERKFNLTIFLIFMAYNLFLLLTLSRACILALLSAFVLTKWRSKIIIYPAIAGGIIILISIMFFNYQRFIENSNLMEKADLYTSAVETGGSNRFAIWMETLQQYFETPSAWLLGFGAGRTIMSFNYLLFTKTVYHPHNTYLYALYCFGIIGFIFLCIFIINAYKKIKTDNYGSLRKLLLIYYLVIFCFDAHLLAAQVVIPHLLILSFLFSKSDDRLLYFENRSTIAVPV